MYLTQALHRAVQQRRDQTFATFAGRTRTYGEVAERVSRAAGGVRALGLASDERVAVLALNSDTYLEVLLAVAWADAVFVPLNTRWSPAELVDYLGDIAPSTIVVDDAFAEIAARLVAEVPSIVRVVSLGGHGPSGSASWESLATGGPAVADARRGGDRIAGIFSTGGTTGRARGVLLSHRALITAALGFSAQRSTPSTSIVVVVAPMFHLAQFSAFVSNLLVGCAHVVLSAFHPADVLAAIERERATRILLVPTMIQMLLDSPEIGTHDLRSLQTIVYGGSSIPAPVVDRARALLPDVELVQDYGMTEAAAVVTVLTPEDHSDPSLLPSAGRAAAHVLIRIVDADTRAEVRSGVVGEIEISGDGLMAGYWGRAEETAAVLRDGWFSTGDAGYLDDRGYLFIVDRIKDMIVSGGENVYSAEVETVLAAHPSIAQCAVIGREDERWGERVHAVVVLRPGATLDLLGLQEHARRSLGGYKIPRGLTVVDALPVSGAGKVLKRELRRTLAEAD